MKEDFHAKFPMLVDMMDNNTSIKYSGFPERLYVILDGTILYAGGQGPFRYDIPELKSWIEDYSKK